MSFHDFSGTRTIRLRALPPIAAVAAVIALFLAQAGGATVSSPRPRTLVATHHWIWTVAQDGGRIAWISRLATHHCGLHVKTISTGRTEATRVSKYDCDQFGNATHLALANRAAAWAEGYSCGNNECFWTVASATAGDRRARKVETQDISCDTDACGGEPDPTPYLAGAGRLIVYSNGQGNPSFNGRTVVERIRGGRASRLFDVAGEVYGMSLVNGLIATASLSLSRGDGCGCLDAPVWSPDGSRIAYLKGRFDRYGGGYGTVALMNADGSGRHDITPFNSIGSATSSPSWSPDGTKIAYDGVPSGQIWVASADGSVLSKLASGYEPAWSPDGTKIAFVSTGGIFVTHPDGSNTQQLLSTSSNVGNLAWSPDGTRIAFSLAGVLEVMNADGSNVHLLGSAVAGSEPAWSPDGSQVAFRNADGLAVIGADGSGQRQLTIGPDAHPSWSPDGKTILFASDRNDAYANGGIYTDDVSPELYLVDPDGGDLHPLSFSQPTAWVNAVAIHSTGGKLISTLPGLPARLGRVTSGLSTTLAGDVAAVAGVLANGDDQITLFDARSEAEWATVRVGTGQLDFGVVGGNPHWVVFELGRTLSALDTATHRVIRLAGIPANPVDISVSGRRVVWAENSGKAPRRHGRIRTVELPS